MASYRSQLYAASFMQVYRDTLTERQPEYFDLLFENDLPKCR